MKNQILKVVVTLLVISTLSIAGFAGFPENLKANIPFDFMVSGKKLAAGTYTIRSTAQHVLSIHSWNMKQGAFVTTMDLQVSAENKPQLVFHRYGNQYFLAKVISPTGGIEVPKSKAEREAAKAGRDTIVKNDLKPEIITVRAQIGQ